MLILRKMICYLIPECKTCIKQEKLLKAYQNPAINIRYVPMNFAKSTPYKYPLWIFGKDQYQGILNSFGEIRKTTPKKIVNSPLTKLKVPALPRPGGPRNSNPSNIFQNKSLNLNKPSILSNFGKKSCFGKSLLDGRNSRSEQNIINNINNSMANKMYKSAGKAGATLTRHGLKSLKSNNRVNSPLTKLKVPALPRPGGPRNSNPSNIFQNKSLNLNKPSILSNFGKKSCFGKSLLDGRNSRSEQNIINNINNSMANKMYKSAGKAGATLTQHDLKSLKSNNRVNIKQNKTGITLTFKR